MDKPKFTPGPWEVSDADDFASNRIGVAESNGDQMILCDLNDSTGFEQEVTQANARLMASAPDLLDGLRDAVVLALVGVVPAKDTIARWNELIKKAEDRQ